MQPGANTLEIVSGPRNPARQYRWWRWENLQFRNVRLLPEEPSPAAAPLAVEWTALPAPGGWSETNRLRLGVATPDAVAPTPVWLTGNRPGELWRFTVASDGQITPLINAAANLATDVIFDIADAGAAQVVATARGLFWRSDGGDWSPVQGAPAAAMFVAWHDAGTWYAGGEQTGLWLARHPAGPWTPAGLDGRTLLDLTVALGRLTAATASGVYVREDGGWTRLPLPSGERGPAAADFAPRLWRGADGALVVRSEDRLFSWRAATAAWAPFGPPELAGALYTVIDCCAPGTLVGGNLAGLWRQLADGAWQRTDGNVFDYLEITGGLRVGNRLLLATTNGLFAGPADGAGPFVTPAGLPATVTDLLPDPADAQRLLAGTPAGVFRSQDGGASWAPISPPWIVWDMAFGPDGRLYVARMDGIAWADRFDATPVHWQSAASMASVTFFTVSPDPANPAQVWAGSWGNDIGVSMDSGATFQPLHNGLETLSVLAILRHPTPGQFTVGTIEELYRSDDDGASWFKLPGALAAQTIYALWQTADGALLAGATNGLWRSDDYGVTWQHSKQLPPATVLRLGALRIAGSDLLWAGTEGAGLWLSEDGGATWQPAGLQEHTVYQALADPNDPQRLLVATEQGIFRGSPLPQ